MPFATFLLVLNRSGQKAGVPGSVKLLLIHFVLHLNAKSFHISKKNEKLLAPSGCSVKLTIFSGVLLIAAVKLTRRLVSLSSRKPLLQSPAPGETQQLPAPGLGTHHIQGPWLFARAAINLGSSLLDLVKVHQTPDVLSETFQTR